MTYIIDDRNEIPDYLLKMSEEELRLEIERLEREHKKRNGHQQYRYSQANDTMYF
jgi:hypothetical protein